MNIAKKNPREKEVPFDSERKLMTTVNKVGEKYIAYTKGGVDEILARCIAYEISDGVKTNLDEYKIQIKEQNEEMARNALRVLACGYKILDSKPSDEEMRNIEKDLIFIRNVWDDRPTKRRSKTCCK